MRTHLRTLFTATALVIGLSLSLTACSTIGRIAESVGVDVIPASVQQKALKSAYVAFTAWEGIQGGVKVYGHLPPCVTGGPIVCKSSRAWLKIRAIEKQMTAYIQTTRPLIEAGSTDVEQLLAISETVYDAKALIDAAKADKED